MAIDVTTGKRQLWTALDTNRETRPGLLPAIGLCSSVFEFDALGDTSAIHRTLATPGDKPGPHNTQRTCPILIIGRVYDLGWRENWRRVMAQRSTVVRPRNALSRVSWTG